MTMMRNIPVDKNDPEGAMNAIPLELPEDFSEKAQAAWSYFDGTAFLFEYKGKLVVTDESMWLTEYGDGTAESPLGFPRWVCDNMKELEEELEEVYENLKEDGEIEE